MRRFIVIVLQAVAQWLRQSADSTQRWVDQMQAASVTAAPLQPEAEPLAPPEHWRKQTEIRPPEHWLAMIQQHAPHLLTDGFPQYDATGEPTSAPIQTAPNDAAPNLPTSPNTPARMRLTPIGRPYKGVIQEISTSVPDSAKPIAAQETHTPAAPPLHESISSAPDIDTQKADVLPASDALEALASFSDFVTPFQPSSAQPAPDVRPTEETPPVSPHVSQVATKSPAQPVIQQSATQSPTPPKVRFGAEADQRPTRLTPIPRPIQPTAPEVRASLRDTKPEMEPVTPPSSLLKTKDESPLTGPAPLSYGEGPGVRSKPSADLRSRVSVPPVKPTATMPAVIVPRVEPSIHIETPDESRWASLLEEDEPQTGPLTSSPSEDRDHRRRLDQEQRGQSWNE